MTARKNGTKTIPGFVSGTTGGLLFITLPVVCVWAMLRSLSVKAPAITKVAPAIAKALRKAFVSLKLLITWP